MKTIALLTSLLIGGSSVAIADPPRRDQDHDRDSYRYGDHDRYDRFGDSRWSREYRNRWTAIGSRFTPATKSNQIILRGRGRFDKIRVEADRGQPVITGVTVEYMNNATQVITMRSRLSTGSGEVIRLNRDTPIKRVIVYAEPRAGGRYTVYGA